MKRLKALLALLCQKKVWVPMAAASLLILLYMGFVNHTEPTEIGIARNWVTGDMWIQEGGGFHVNPPWVWVACVDTRPMRVSVPSGGRGYHAKLIQFQPDKWKDFVEIEGWRFYWLSNRLSINFGHDEEHRGLRDVLRGYAYSPKQHSFLKVLQEFDVAP